jgi:hypothetical protein
MLQKSERLALLLDMRPDGQARASFVPTGRSVRGNRAPNRKNKIS